MEGLDFAPFPGAKGQDFFENVSKQAWQEWLQLGDSCFILKRITVLNVYGHAQLQLQPVLEKFHQYENIKRKWKV
jgi:Fe-S cluster biosynthesis and repair protein YggX